MRTSKFTETQIVAALKRADAGVPVKDICRENPGQRGLSEVASAVLEAKLPHAARAGDF